MSVGYYPHATQAFGLRAVGFSPSQGRWPWHAFGVTLCALEAHGSKLDARGSKLDGHGSMLSAHGSSLGARLFLGGVGRGDAFVHGFEDACFDFVGEFGVVGEEFLDGVASLSELGVAVAEP